MKKSTAILLCLNLVIVTLSGQISKDSLSTNFQKNLFGSKVVSAKKLNSVCKEDSTVYYVYDTTTLSYNKSGVDIYEFTNSLKLSKVRSYFLNASNWIPSAMITYSYDASDNLLVEEPMQLGFTNNFSNLSKTLYTYDNLNNLISEITQVWNSNPQGWSNRTRYTSSYNANSKISTLIIDTWYTSTQTWLPNYRYTYNYSAAGTLTTQTGDTWQNNSSTWKHTGISLFSYTNSRLASILSSQWDNASSTYTPSLKQSYSYDSSGNQIDLLTESWDNGNSTWKNVEKNTTPYTSAGLKSTDELYTWHAPQQIWLKNKKLSFSYDSFNNLVQQIVEYAQVSPSKDYWTAYEKWQNIYDCSNAVGIPSLNKKANVIKIYPNPAKDFLSVESGKEFSEITVFNLTGQKVLSVVDEKTLDVSLLEKGIYFMQVLDKNKTILATEKFVKD